MPDFDIDFCQDGRDRVIDYVKQKYGADSVSQIATFGTLAAKAAVRDVGRVLDLPYSFVDGIAKLIPFQPGKTVTLRRRAGDARVQRHLRARSRAAARRARSDEEEVRELLSLAEELEGLPRNVGMHAGGVLIAPGKLTDFCPLYVQPGAERAGVAVRQGRRRGGRPRQVRLPRPHHAHDPRLDAALRPRSSIRSRRSRSRRCRSTTADVRHLPQGQHHRRVPVRIARHARPPEAGAADALRGHHRAGRAVPAGPDGAHPRLRRAQERPRARRVPRPAPRADPRADLRRHGVPGTGDADRAGDRRLHARRRRPAAPRDGQEEARGDGEAARHLRRRAPRRTACRDRRRRSSST